MCIHKSENLSHVEIIIEKLFSITMYPLPTYFICWIAFATTFSEVLQLTCRL